MFLSVSSSLATRNTQSSRQESLCIRNIAGFATDVSRALTTIARIAFIIFVTALVFGVLLFDSLTWAYFTSLTDTPSSSPACLHPASVCSLAATDMFLFSVAVWSTLQLIWTIVLLVSQLVQIAHQMTTLEVSNFGRYGYMGAREDALSGDSTSAGAHVHGHGHRHGSGCNTNFLMQLFGFDRFTSGKMANGFARSGHAANPFNMCIVGNCRDFWTRGCELDHDEAEEGEIPGRKGHGLRQKLFLGLEIGGPSARGSGGYEPVSQV
ncbi:hypothetical protein BGW80DRAFT_1461693 [Lactifluus volemus]|nr:hypothetical protein BGW80DRAFT_1461693 [Lactifluus volemus]